MKYKIICTTVLMVLGNSYIETASDIEWEKQAFEKAFSSNVCILPAKKNLEQLSSQYFSKGAPLLLVGMLNTARYSPRYTVFYDLHALLKKHKAPDFKGGYKKVVSHISMYRSKEFLELLRKDSELCACWATFILYPHHENQPTWDLVISSKKDKSELDLVLQFYHDNDSSHIAGLIELLQGEHSQKISQEDLDGRLAFLNKNNTRN